MAEDRTATCQRCTLDFVYEGFGRRRKYCFDCNPPIYSRVEERGKPGPRGPRPTPEQVADRVMAADLNLGIPYISPAAYRELMRRQGDACLICSRPMTDVARGKFHVDHCHDTGRFRGMLCPGCNHGMGNFRDCPATLLAAARYAARWLPR